MKIRFVSLLLSLFIGTYIYGQNAIDYTLSGEIRGLASNIVMYLKCNNSKGGADTISQTKVTDGKFIFNLGDKLEAQWYFLFKSDNSSSYISVFLENFSRNVKVMGDNSSWPDLRISGSKTYSEYNSYKAFMKPFFKESDSLTRLLQDELSIRKNRLEREFIESNSSSLCTPTILLNSTMGSSEKKILYDGLSVDVKNSLYGKQLLEQIQTVEITEGIKIGNSVPEFSSGTITGGTVYFKDIFPKNRLTLIDFWASWCVPCRHEIPNLKKVYADFHRKGFDILSVSLDASEKDWKDALIKEAMLWPQVSQLKGQDEYAGKIFGIKGIPASVLVDDKGKIVAIDAPGASIPSGGGSLRGEGLYRTVEKVLGQSVSSSN